MANTHQKDELARSIDSGLIVVAFAGASGIATAMSKVGLFKWPQTPKHSLQGWPPDYLILLVTSLVLWAVVSGWSDVYRSDRLEDSRQAYWRLGRTLLLWVGTTALALFFLKVQTVSRQFNLLFFCLTSALVLCRSLLERGLYSRRIKGGRPPRSAVVVGPPGAAEWLVGILSARPEWYGSVNILDLESVAVALNGDTANATGHALRELAEVFILPGVNDQTLREEIALRLVKQGRIVHMVPALIDAQLFRRNLGDIEGVPTITLETTNPRRLEAFVKRLMDVTVSSILLVILSPIMLVLGALLKITSPGPVLFKQQRLGKDGNMFTIFKFRTMRTDAEAVLHEDPKLLELYRKSNFKLPDGMDYRVTRLGKLLRCTSLDELPQLINVLCGQMSLVGPRPIVPAEIEKYGDYASLFLSLKPGITGNWQVSGRSRIEEYAERVKLDIEYARDQSARKDVQILIRTVGAVARMDGAY
jgi:exopolysaccharide production protein ExoY